MSRYLQFLGTDGINVELSSVNFDPYEQVNYLFSLDSSFVNNNNIVIPSLVNTVEEQQKTLEEQQKTLRGKGTVASVTAGTGMTQIGTDTFNPTLNVIGGDGITANADDITVDSTVVRTTGSQTIAGNKSFSNDVNIAGDITGGSAVFSSVSALTANFLQTIISSTSALSVVNNGTGPALYVQQDGNEPIAHFIDKTGDDIIFADNGFVGIGTFNPAEKLTVSGNISASGGLSATGSVKITGDLAVSGSVDGRDVSTDGTKLDGIEASADVTDTANVTTAGALMDSEVTNLAQVKAFDSSDYATSAQGTLATNALPKSGGAMTGAITTNSTFDGRDVATDGTKLDGIEASADVTDTANVTAAGALMDSEVSDLPGIKSVTINSLQVKPSEGAFANGDKTKLDGIEASADVTDATNVAAAGALMDSEVTNLAQVKAFDSSDYATSAQGATADAALPKTGGAMTGAITTNSTFDGRDVATDGTKLDGIEASADVTDTANVTSAGALMDSELTDLAGIKAVTISTLQVKPSEGAFANGDKTKLDGIEASADVTDTTNVTSAGALMDSEVTNLAQVKAFDSSDYATAAQGATADAALPKTGGAMTGAITTNSTFDGRDVATDGTKLDGIEASADVTDTANVTSAGALMDSEVTDLAGIKAVTISTLQVKPSEGAFANGDKTKLDGIEASADVTDTTNVTSAGALMDSEVTNLAQVKAFDSSDYATSAQGTLATNALPKSGGTMSGAIAMGGNNITGGGNFTTTGVTGQDVQIGVTDSGLIDTSSGNLELGSAGGTTILGDTNISVTNNLGIGTTSPDELFHVKGSATTLKAKIESTGSNSYPTLRLTNDARSYDLQIDGATDAFRIYDSTGTVERFTLTSGGDIGIGVTSPASKLHIADNHSQLRLTDTDDSKFLLHSYSGGKYVVRNNSTSTTVNQFTLTEDGKFGIGTISPAYPFALENSGSGLIARIYNSNADGDGVLIRAGSTSSATRALQVASTNDTKILTVNSNGRVGITTTSPDYLLDIGGDTASANNTIRMVQANNGTAIRIGAGGAGNDVNLLRVDGNVSAGGHRGETNSSNFGYSLRYKGSGSGVQNSLAFFVDNLNAVSQVEAFTILNDGKIGIGASAPSEKLTVSGNISANGSLSATGSANIAGNLFVSGSIDGRDVATDGTKLDGIEASADVTDTANVTAAGALMDSEITNLAQVKAFDSSDYATSAQGTLATNALPKSGGTMSGAIAMGSQNITGVGQIGIGTTSPGHELTVSGSGTVASFVSSNSKSVINLSDDGGDANLISNSGTFHIGSTSTDLAKFMINLSTGKVGIGTSSPDELFHIKGSATTLIAKIESTGSNSYPSLRLTNDARSWNLQIDGATDAFRIYDSTSTAERFRITSSGNVGIGATSPASLLHLASTGPAVLTIEADTDNATETDNARIVLKQDGALVVGRMGYENNTNALEFINEFNDSLSLGTNNTKRLTINGTGYANFTSRVGIGIASPEQELHVYQGTAKFESTNGSDVSLQLGRSDVANLWNFNHAGSDLRIYNSGGSGYDVLFGVNSGGTSQSNKVGINTATPSHQLDVNGTFQCVGDATFDANVNAAGVITTGGNTEAEVKSWLHAGRQWSFSGLPFFNKTSGSTAQRLDGAFMTDLNTGSAASRRAQAVFGAGFNDISGYSGAGTDYSRALGASIKAGFFISGQNSASVIFAVGLASTSGVFADDDPISNYGFGVEFRRGSGSTTEWRVFAHDGTTFTASTFTSTGITYSVDPRTIAIYSDGAGNVTAYTAMYGSTSYTTATTTGGPTASSGTSTSTNMLGLRCNTNASSYVSGAHAKARASAVNLYAE